MRAFFTKIALNAFYPHPPPCALRVCSVSAIEESSTLQRWIESNGAGSPHALYLLLLAEGYPQASGLEVFIGFDAPSSYPKLSLALPASEDSPATEEQQQDHASFLLRSIEPDAANIGLSRQWLASCGEEHECLKQQTSNTNLSGILHVIDCELMSVLPALAAFQYVALSYWYRIAMWMCRLIRSRCCGM